MGTACGFRHLTFVKHDHRAFERRPSQRPAGFYPADDCPRWLPLALIGGAAVYAALGWIAYLLIF